MRDYPNTGTHLIKIVWRAPAKNDTNASHLPPKKDETEKPEKPWWEEEV